MKKPVHLINYFDVLIFFFEKRKRRQNLYLFSVKSTLAKNKNNPHKSKWNSAIMREGEK